MTVDDESSEISDDRFEKIVLSQVGRILMPNRYRIDQLLGKNMNDAVFLAANEQKESLVTIRVFRTIVLNENDYQYKRFKQEVKRLMGLNHRNISRVLDHGLLKEGLPFIVLENIYGPNLAEILVQQNRLDAFQTGAVFGQLSKGVQYAHEQGILHETLKPSRIIIAQTADDEYTVKVAGFGLMSLYNKLGINLRTPQSKAEFIGSAAYMSPEQCYEGSDVDIRSDIYSIGCMMYEALSGQVPFLGANMDAVMKMHLESDATPIPVVRKDLKEFPKRLLAIIDKCMHKDPTQRYQFVSDLQSDIEKDIDPEERERRTIIPVGLQKAEQRVKESKESPVRLIVTISAVAIVLFGVLFGGSYVVTLTSKMADNGILQAKIDTAKKAFSEGKIDEAIESYDAAVKEARKFPKPDIRLARTLNEISSFNITRGLYSPAIIDLREAKDIEDNAKAKDEEVNATTFELLSRAELVAGRNREAESHAKDSIAISERISGESTERLYRSYIQLFKVQYAANQMKEAQVTVDKIKGSFSHSNVILPIDVITGEKQAEALILQSSGKYAEAEAILQDVLGTRQQKLGPAALPSIETMVALGKLYYLQHKTDKSVKIFKAALEARKKSLGEKAPAVLEINYLIAQVFDAAKNAKEAEAYYRSSLEMAENDFGKGNNETLPYIVSLAKFLRDHKQISAAQVYETEMKEIQHPERVPLYAKEKKLTEKER